MSEPLNTFYLTDDGELPDGFPLPEPLPLDFDRESILSRIHAVNDSARRAAPGSTMPLAVPLTLTLVSGAALILLILLVMVHF